MQGNINLTEEEKNKTEKKKSRFKNPYEISNYKEIRNTIDLIADQELCCLIRDEKDDLLDDYMWLDNYDNSNNIDLKVLVN